MARLKLPVTEIVLASVLLLASLAVPSLSTSASHSASSPQPVTQRDMARGSSSDLGRFSYTSTNRTVLSSISVLPSAATVSTGGVQAFTSLPDCTNGSRVAACPSTGIAYTWALNNTLGIILLSTGSSVLFTAGSATGVVNVTLQATLNGSAANSYAIITIVPSTGSASNTTILIAILIVVIVVAAFAMISVTTRRRKREPRQPRTQRKDGQSAPGQAKGAPAPSPKTSPQSDTNPPQEKESKGRLEIPCPKCQTLVEEGTETCQVCGWSLEKEWSSMKKE